MRFQSERCEVSLGCKIATWIIQKALLIIAFFKSCFLIIKSTEKVSRTETVPLISTSKGTTLKPDSTHFTALAFVDKSCAIIICLCWCRVVSSVFVLHRKPPEKLNRFCLLLNLKDHREKSNESHKQHCIAHRRNPPITPFFYLPSLAEQLLHAPCPPPPCPCNPGQSCVTNWWKNTYFFFFKW